MTSQRQFLRKTADRIVSVTLESNELESKGPESRAPEAKDRAIVLDISDGGLGFHALQPLSQTGTIRFSFTHRGEWIEASGELVWIDSRRVTGGLRFSSLPSATLARLHELVDPPVVVKKVEAPPQPANDVVAIAEPLPPEAHASDVAADSIPGSTSTPVAPLTAPPPPSEFVKLEPPPMRATDKWALEPDLRDSRGRTSRGIAIVAIFLVILGVIVFVANGSQVGQLFTQAKSAGDTAPHAASSSKPQPVPEPGPPPPAPAAIADSTADPKTNDPATYPATKTSAVPVQRTQEATSNSADYGEADLALAQRYLGAKAGPESDTIAARILWGAVGKGNVRAEITLADLYARGDGVMQNCNQAEALLRAATGKGSNEAAEALAQILRSGCRR